MGERLKNRIREVLPSVLALLRWLVLAGLTGLACGLAGLFLLGYAADRVL